MKAMDPLCRFGTFLICPIQFTRSLTAMSFFGGVITSLSTPHLAAFMLSVVIHNGMG